MNDQPNREIDRLSSRSSNPLCVQNNQSPRIAIAEQPTIPTAPRQHRKRPKRTDRHDTWGSYHVLIALIILIGAFWGIHSIDQLVHYLERLNALEESGLVACVLVVATKVSQAVRTVSAWVMAILGH